MQAEIKTQVRGFLTRSFASYNPQDDEDIFAMGFVTSLFAIQLVLFVEREFEISVENEDLTMDNFRSIDTIVHFVERKTAALPQIRS